MTKEDDLLDEVAKLLAVDNDEMIKGENQLDKLNFQTQSLVKQSAALDNSLTQLVDSDDFMNAMNNASSKDLQDLADILGSNKSEAPNPVELLDIMKTSDDWQQLLKEGEVYASRNEIDLSNPYLSGMSQVEFTDFSHEMMEKLEISRLDKYDYAFAGVVGLITGLIDAFFVGSITDGNNVTTKSNQGSLSKAVDKGYDKIVQRVGKSEKLTQLMQQQEAYRKQHNGQINSVIQNNIEKAKNMDVKQAIKVLEQNHRVSYDAAQNGYILHGGVEGMNPSNHHLFSLAHDPGLLGLIIGVVDQLTGKATFIDKMGHISRRVTTNASSLNSDGSTGKQIIDAIVNWWGHTLSDIAGSSSAKGRGAGLPGPFYELTQKLQFGNFDVNGSSMNTAQLAEWLYKQGLDMRALTAQAIPVFIAEILIRLYWLFKRHFYLGMSWKESLPFGNNTDLQKILFVSIATFEVVDISDAVIREEFTPLALLRINFVGVMDLGFRSIQTLRNQLKHVSDLRDYVDKDIQDEWIRILQTE